MTSGAGDGTSDGLQVAPPAAVGQVNGQETLPAAADQPAPVALSRPARYLEHAAVRVTLAYLAVRAVLLVAAVLAAHQSYGGHLGGPFVSWDSHFYLEIAQSGYPHAAPVVNGRLTFSPAGFPPGFPMLIRIFAHLGVPEVGAGIVASVVAGWVATVVLFRLGQAIGGEVLGLYSAALFMVFPGMGVAWGLIYSESAGTALVACSLYFMMKGRWALAGLMGALGTATSPVAMALAPAALVPAVRQLRQRQWPTALLCTAMTPLGLGAFALWEAARYHDLFFYWHLQSQAWGVAIDWGKGLALLLPHLWRAGYQGPSWLEWTAVVAVAGTAVALWRAKLPGFITVYTVAALAELGLTNQGLKVRLLTWAFPGLIAVAATLKPHFKNALVLLFMGLLPLVFLAYTTLGNTMVQP